MNRLSLARRTQAIEANDFADPELRQQFEEIMERLTAIKDPDEGYVPATLAAMSDEDARAVTQMILELTLSIAGARLDAARN